MITPAPVTLECRGVRLEPPTPVHADAGTKRPRLGAHEGNGHPG